MNEHLDFEQLAGADKVSYDLYVDFLWLRLGRRAGRPNDRCDLLAVRVDSGKYTLEYIEVKTTQAGDPHDDSEDITHARDQVKATLDACAAALPDNTTGQDPLSAPRCEMLKQIFVRACQSRAISADLRGKWCGWLPILFQQESQRPLSRSEAK